MCVDSAYDATNLSCILSSSAKYVTSDKPHRTLVGEVIVGPCEHIKRLRKLSVDMWIRASDQSGDAQAHPDSV